MIRHMFKKQHLFDLLVIIAVGFLPFTQALTLDLKFPFKIYEFLLVIAIGWGAVTLDPKLLHINWKIVGPAVALWMVAALSLAVAPSSSAISAAYAVRFGPTGDGLAKLVYFLFVLLSFSIILNVSKDRWHDVANAWLAGAIFAAVYSLVLCSMSFADVHPSLLPGLERHQTFSYAGHKLIRSGTFEEGNFAGLFFILSVGLAMQTGRRFLAVLFTLAVLATFSTISITALFILWLVYGYYYLVNGRLRLGVKIATISLAVFSFFIFLRSDYANEVFRRKLVTDQVISRNVRLEAARMALNAVRSKPILGIGLSQFGYHFPEFQPKEERKAILTNEPRNKDLNSPPASPNVPVERILLSKRIINNVYLEILAETGVLGFLCFLAFLVVIVRMTWKNDAVFLKATFIGLLLVFNAYPSFSVLFIWAFFALMVSYPVWKDHPYKSG